LLDPGLEFIGYKTITELSQYDKELFSDWSEVFVEKLSQKV